MSAARTDEANRKRAASLAERDRDEAGRVQAREPSAATSSGATGQASDKRSNVVAQLVQLRCSGQSAAWLAEQRRIADEANRKRAAAIAGQERDETGRVGAKATGGCTTSATTGVKAKVAVTREAKAAASKTNRGTVERMDRLVSERPDLAEWQ